MIQVSKKIIVFLLLLFGLVSCKTQEPIIEKNRIELFSILDNFIKEDSKFKFLEFELGKKCPKGLMFGLSKKNVFEYSDFYYYRTYNYKDNIIIYDLPYKEKDKNVINFFDSYLKKSDFNITELPQGNQSVVFAIIVLYMNDQFYGDKKTIFEVRNKNGCE